MAQVIRPEVWQEGIDDNRLLPGRYTTGLFTGSGVKIANNNEACRVWDIQVTDYITDYDDRRINGLGGPTKNTEGRDGWGASAYGVFQDVRFDSRVYTMGRHRSVAMRIFDEMQYSGDIGEWGTDTTSNVITNGNSLMATAQILNKARDIWEKQVLGPDIDRYNLFAVCNGHISGRFVQTNPDKIFDGEGQWIAQPGPVQGQAIPPRFAPIHAIEFDDDNIPLFLQNIKVTWNNLFIPQDNRVILIDPFYEYKLLASLTGKGVPATDSAYTDIQNGSFTKLMGWEFRFDIPTQYWPQIYVDANLNVVHSADGNAAYDKILNSIAGGDNPDLMLQNSLAASNRMSKPNFVRTVWDEGTSTFKKVVTNYPLGMPGAAPYLGEAVEIENGIENYGEPTTYPWTAPGSGYGIEEPTGPVKPITRVQVIGMAVYKPAAQLSQEYSNMVTDEGLTRGKFTEMVMDVKYDAWVIESLSHGILPIIDAKPNTGVFAIPVEVVDNGLDRSKDSKITKFEVDNAVVSLTHGQQAAPVITVEGTGDFSSEWVAYSSDSTIASVDPQTGVITAEALVTDENNKQATITYRSVQDPTKTATVTVTVTKTASPVI